LFEHAKLVIMGGSFVEVGGHNILEPALFQRPIITGPFMNNFADELLLLQEFKGIDQVTELTELNQHIMAHLNNPELAEKMGKHALQAIQTQKNILQNYLEKLDLL